MQDRTVTASVAVANPLGIHLRPADLIAKTVARYSSRVRVKCNGQEVDGKSIIELLMMAARQGTEVLFTATGPDADDVCRELVALVNNGFGELEPDDAPRSQRSEHS
jgi:phosphocarrier protein